MMATSTRLFKAASSPTVPRRRGVAPASTPVVVLSTILGRRRRWRSTRRRRGHQAHQLRAAGHGLSGECMTADEGPPIVERVTLARRPAAPSLRGVATRASTCESPVSRGDTASAGLHAPRPLCRGEPGHGGSPVSPAPRSPIRSFVRRRARRGAPADARERGPPRSRVADVDEALDEAAAGSRVVMLARRARRGADASTREAALQREGRHAAPLPDRQRRGLVLRREGGEAPAPVR